MSGEQIFELYVNMLYAVLPCAFVIGVSNLVVSMFLNAFFKGKLKIGGDS